MRKSREEKEQEFFDRQRKRRETAREEERKKERSTERQGVSGESRGARGRERAIARGKLSKSELQELRQKETIQKLNRKKKIDEEQSRRKRLKAMEKEYSKEHKVSRNIDKAKKKGEVYSKREEVDGKSKRVKYNPFSYKSNLRMLNSIVTKTVNRGTGGLLGKYNKRLSKKYGEDVSLNLLKRLPIFQRVLLITGVLLFTVMTWVASTALIVFLSMSVVFLMITEEPVIKEGGVSTADVSENVEMGGGGPAKNLGNQHIPMSKPFMLPVKNTPIITSPWLSIRRLKTNNGWQNRPHVGTDLSCNSSHGIYAAGDGVVETSSYNSGWGNFVIIEHGEEHSRLRTLYAHMTNGTVVVKVGQTVKGGQKIGMCGKTGNVTGPHLHFEVWKPKPYKYSKVDLPLESNAYLGAPKGYTGVIK